MPSTASIGTAVLAFGIGDGPRRDDAAHAVPIVHTGYAAQVSLLTIWQRRCTAGRGFPGVLLGRRDSRAAPTMSTDKAGLDGFRQLDSCNGTAWLLIARLVIGRMTEGMTPAP